MFGRGQILFVGAALFGVLALLLVSYVTVSPLMFWALLVTIVSFAFMLIMALNPALSAMLLSGIFGSVKLPENKKLLPEKGILLAKFENMWYATAYVAIHVTRPFTSMQADVENLQNITKLTMNMIDALGSLQRPIAFMLMFVPVPKARQKLEEYFEATAYDKHMPVTGGLLANPYRKAKAEVRYDMLRELIQRLHKGEQVYDAIRIVRVTDRGGTPKEAIENVERLADKVAGVITGSLPNSRAERVVGEEFIRLVHFEYGYMPQQRSEFRDDFQSLLAKQARPP